MEKKSTVSISLLKLLLKNTQDTSKKEADFLEKILLPVIQSNTVYLSRTQAYHIISQFTQYSNETSPCVLSVNSTKITSTCALERLFLSSHYLHEALYYLERFSTLLTDALDIQISKQGHLIKILLLPNGSFLSEQTDIMELYVSTLIIWFKKLLGLSVNFTKIHLKNASSEQSLLYQKKWHTNVLLNQTEYALYLNSNIEVDTKDQEYKSDHIKQTILYQIKKQSHQLSHFGSLCSRIRYLMHQNKISLTATHQQIASYCNIHTDSLKRALKKEPFTLKQIINECRISMASDQLTHSKKDITLIAHGVGLSSRRSLDRLFMRHTNQSAAQYRKKHSICFSI